MIILNVFFNVKQDDKEEFLRLLNGMVVESNKEDGCSFYQLFHNDHEGNSYMLVEHWNTQQQLDTHGRTPHWKHFDETVNGYLHSDYDEHHYTEIPA